MSNEMSPVRQGLSADDIMGLEPGLAEIFRRVNDRVPDAIRFRPLSPQEMDAADAEYEVPTEARLRRIAQESGKTVEEVRANQTSLWRMRYQLAALDD
jgi:hypothetical protein